MSTQRSCEQGSAKLPFFRFGPEAAVVLVAVLAAESFWLLDAFIHSHILHETTFLRSALTNMQPHQLHVRLFVLMAFTVFGSVLAVNMRRLRRSRDRLERSNTLLRAIHEAGAGGESPASLVEKVCHAYSETSAFVCSWAVLLDESGNVLAHAASGQGQGCSGILQAWEHGEPPGCIVEFPPAPSADVHVSARGKCNECPASEGMRRSEASMIVAIDHGSRRHGFMGVRASTSVARDANERALLETVSRDVAAALAAGEARAARAAAAAELRTSEQHNRMLVRDLDAKLRESEYRHIWEVHRDSPIPAFTTDDSGRIIDYNRAMEQLTGYSHGEMPDVGTWMLLTHPDEQERREAEDAVRQMIAERKGMVREVHPLWHRSGKKLSVEYSTTFLSHNGVPTGVELVQAVDVTEERATEAALRWESEVNLALAVLSNSLLRTRSLEEISRLVLKTGKRLTGSEHGFVASVDTSTGDVVTHTVTEMMGGGCTIHMGSAEEIRFPRNPDGTYAGLWGHALNTRQAFYKNSPATHPSSNGLPEGHVPLRNFLTAPAVAGDELVGQVALASAADDYTDRDLAAARRLADLLAIAVQRHRDELKLETERDRAQNYLNVAGAMLVGLDPAGNVLMMNPRACEVLETTAENAVGKNWFDTFLPEDAREPVRDVFRGMMSGDVAKYGLFENLVLTAKGHKRLVLWRNTVRYDSSGMIVGTLASGEDVTERKRREDLLRTLNRTALATETVLETEGLFHVFADELAAAGIRCAVFAVEPGSDELRFRHTNLGERLIKATEMMTGGRREEYAVSISGSEALTRVLLRRQALFFGNARPIAEDLLPRTAKRFAGKLTRLIGLERLAAAPVVIGQSVMGMLLMISEDLCEDDIPTVTAFASLLAAGWRKTALLVELQKNIDELKRTRDQLVQAHKMEAIGTLAGGIAHDFNNLLTAIGGYSDLLLMKLEDESLRSSVEQIKGASDRAAGLTRQLLAFSRQQPLQPRVIDTNSAVTVIDPLLRRLIGEDIAFTVNLSQKAGSIRVDPSQMEQVLLNLAVNARDAMPTGGVLTIATDREVVTEANVPARVSPGTYATITVSDTGSGIESSAIERIFEPFYTTKEVGKGTGLGLSVVYGIVRQHGGFIDVQSEVGKGTSFRIHLPMVATDAVDAQAGDARQELCAGSGERILLVEDEDAVRGVTSRMLERNGYSVTVAANVEQALTLLEKGEPEFDLVFSDVVLPGRSGIWLAEHLSKDRPELRVLLGSGYTDQKSQWPRIQEMGFDFIQKPYKLPELLEAVRDTMRGTGR